VNRLVAGSAGKGQEALRLSIMFVLQVGGLGFGR
jgi:hypothetical protein